VNHFKIAAVIPAFNARASVGDVVEQTCVHIPKVVVVDDGSEDDTAEVARESGAEVLIHPENRGKGAALRTAFEYLASTGWKSVVTLDADGQHLPDDIPALLGAFEPDVDLVLGTRDHLFEEMIWFRQLSNAISSRLISIAAGTRLADVQTGFRIYSMNLLAVTGFEENRFDAESAVVVRASRSGFRIATVPVHLGYVDGRCTSHYRPIVDSLRIARSVIRAWLRKSRPFQSEERLAEPQHRQDTKP
jgi:glycosyltransferase involved in cell wall biosynthesis